MRKNVLSSTLPKRCQYLISSALCPLTFHESILNMCYMYNALPLQVPSWACCWSGSRAVRLRWPARCCPSSPSSSASFPPASTCLSSHTASLAVRAYSMFVIVLLAVLTPWRHPLSSNFCLSYCCIMWKEWTQNSSRCLLGFILRHRLLYVLCLRYHRCR